MKLKIREALGKSYKKPLLVIQLALRALISRSGIFRVFFSFFVDMSVRHKMYQSMFHI